MSDFRTRGDGRKTSERLPAPAPSRSRPARLKTAALLLGVHLAPLVVIVSGQFEARDWVLFALIYPFQLGGVGICLHRYFAHHAFQTSRSFQFLLALAAASSFGDPIRFAGKHRLHHQHADQPGDPHTPRHGFWHAWFGSHLDSGYRDEEVCAEVPWLLRYPELRWLHRHSLVPGLALCGVAFAIGGFSAVAIGVLLGCVLVLHKSSAVNTLCHRSGYRRFDTGDHSSNHWLVALLTCGEGWHNNHHRFPASARAGFAWWEVDLFYGVICLWEKLGLVWDVKQPPERIRQQPIIENPGQVAGA